jgi:hypothetical protein
MAIRDDVLAAITLLSAPEVDEGEVIAEFIARGSSPFRAELLLAFVPLGVGRVLIARLPNMPAQMPDTASIPDPDGDTIYKADLASIAEFTEAVAVADAAYQDGNIPRQTLASAALYGSEMKAIWSARQAGKNLSTSRVGPPFLPSLAEVEGFEEWYRSLVAPEAEPGAAAGGGA